MVILFLCSDDARRVHGAFVPGLWRELETAEPACARLKRLALLRQIASIYCLNLVAAVGLEPTTYGL
jgi:hypothetical protein